MTVIGTLVVGFDGDAATESGAIGAEWDDSKNIDSEGEVKSRWLSRESAWLLVHHDTTATILDVQVTSGSVIFEGAVSLPRTEQLVFPAADEEVSLRYLPAGSLSADWYGNAGEGLAAEDKKAVASGGEFPCVGDISYDVAFRRYRLQLPEVELAIDEEFPVFVVIYYSIEGEL